MNFKLSSYSIYCIRNFSTGRKLMQSHYDSLGVSPKATQADVKAAYYKLSMIYHPDKNKNEKDTQKFRDITAAYEVLGNVKLRRLYDKGMFMGGTSTTHDEPVNKFYQSREHRSKPPPPNGRTPIYDFDEWAKSHYGATFARDMANKKRRHREAKQREDSINEVKQERVLFLMTAIAMFCFYLISQQSSDYDSVMVGDMPLVMKKKKE